ncbi:MAG TPA: cyclodeaminase/cyclohydrolase family protein [Vicinamibacterales bacterium]|nr:cyclodeaminase/cyclohydrolase family protein [Vicinamibacterales bacterium]
MLAEKPLPALLDAFSSPDPTPGGGSAAALMGALGASLLAMVAGLPKTRTGAEDERKALDAARAALIDHQRALTALIDRDAAAYDLVVAAFKKPKATDDEKAARTAAIQDAMRIAAEVPLETARVCSAVVRSGRAVAQYGNLSAKSDIAVALQALGAGMQSAWFNVEINLGSIKDAAVVDAIVAEMRRITKENTEAWMDVMRDAGIADLMKATGTRLGVISPTGKHVPPE